jgi:hypothetical protein
VTTIAVGATSKTFILWLGLMLKKEIIGLNNFFYSDLEIGTGQG